MSNSISVNGGPGRELQHAVRRVLRRSRHLALVSSATAILFTVPDAQAQDSTPAAKNTDPEPALQEIVVSAQKRTQSLQDVPYNISAISGSALQDAGIVSMNGLTQAVPGLTNVDQGPANRNGNNNYILRGLRTDPPGGGAAGATFSNLTVSPVATYFGETPVFLQMPLDDLERVEVLRGPQGTLYGSGSQAGTIRFIPKRPQFDAISGDISAEGSYTDNSPSANGSVHGVVNLPIADHLALRVVAGEDHMAGFITAVDRAELGPNGVPVPSVPGDLTSGFTLAPVQKGTNSSDQYFVRTALRWQPIEAVDLQLDYLHQHTSMGDSQWGSSWAGGPFDPSFGAWPNATVNTRGGCNFCTTEWIAEPYTDTVNLVDLVTTVDVGLGTVTSATSYYDDSSHSQYDQTGSYYGTAIPPNPNASYYIPFYPYLNYPRIIAGYPIPPHVDNRSFIEELRLVSKPGKYFDYVVGLYYQRQPQSINLGQALEGAQAYDAYIGQPNPSAFGDSEYVYHRDTTFVDKAAFGELTYHLTGAWQVTGGVRFFQQPYSSNVSYQAPLCGAICAANQVDPTGSGAFSSATTFSSHVWKLNSSYDFTSTLKLYATFSEGFRHGGVSGLPPGGAFASPGDLQTFKPDLAKNYEIGVKGSLLDHRINYFADVYLVNIYDFQFDALSLSQISGAFNGKEARSQGVEMESQMALTDKLVASVGYAFTRSYVKQAFDILDYPPYALVPSQGGTGELASLFGGPIPEGRSLPGVSRNIANAALDYSVAAGDFGKLTFRVDGSYRSAQESTLNPASIYNFVIPSVFLANARVTLDAPHNLSYSVFVRNITNNPDISGGVNDQEFANPYRLRNVGTPRTVGLGARFRF